MFMSLISALRNIWFYIVAKKSKKNKLSTLLLFATVAIITGTFSYQDSFSIIPILANITSTYSIWQDDVKKYRSLAIPVSICFIVYAIHVNSLFSIVMELILLIIEIISVVEYNYRNRFNDIGSENYEKI